MKNVILRAFAATALIAPAAWAADAPAPKQAAVAPASNSSASASGANSTEEIRRQKLKADKRLVVADNLTLNDKEAKGFWPLYDSYQGDLAKLNQRISGLVTAFIEAYGKGMIPDDVAQKLMKDSAQIDRDELELKQAHLARVEKVLRPSKVIRYAQIENKIRTVIKYELALALPIAE
jgi:hypothetical protein